MGTRKLKPTSPGARFVIIPDFKEITKSTPEKALLAKVKRTGGRNSDGRITTRHVGGGHKRRYRIVDFKRDKFDVAGKVVAIEYDPNRTSRIALIEYPDGEKRYILWAKDVNVGDELISASDSMPEIRPGNCMKLKHMPLGTFVHNVELNAGKGGAMVRSAGAVAQLQAKEKGFAQIKMPSGEMRLVNLECRATVGHMGFAEHNLCVAGKAGRTRWLGIRPTVRGVAMNPVDHPHGGGEGRAGQGNPHPVTPWGKPTKGGKTRRKKTTDKLIVTRRNGRKL
jgi:large subunit ribosomal protein L2